MYGFHHAVCLVCLKVYDVETGGGGGRRGKNVQANIFSASPNDHNVTVSVEYSSILSHVSAGNTDLTSERAGGGGGGDGESTPAIDKTTEKKIWTVY